MASDLHYRCKGCGELDTIVEISLIPRTVRMIAGPEEWGSEQLYVESEIVIGVGCTNDHCEFWQGEYGNEVGKHDKRWLRVGWAKDFDEIAEVVDDN